MKLKHILGLAFLAGIVAVSCSKSKDNDVLFSEAGWLSSQLNLDAQSASDYVDACSASYADGVLAVNVDFAEDGLRTSQLSPEFIDFAVACFLKDMPENHMADMLNNLSEVEGLMSLRISDAAGDTLVHDIAAPKLKQLYRKNYSEIGFSAAKSALSRIFEDAAPALAEAVNAQSCSYSTSGGFAQYTFTFPAATAYGHITQGSLTGRYLPQLAEKYARMGNFDVFAQNVCERLGIEGYRYIYEAEDGGRSVRASVTWNMINTYQPRQ